MWRYLRTMETPLAGFAPARLFAPPFRRPFPFQTAAGAAPRRAVLAAVTSQCPASRRQVRGAFVPALRFPRARRSRASAAKRNGRSGRAPRNVPWVFQTLAGLLGDAAPGLSTSVLPPAMESETSRIPVYSFHHPAALSGGGPADTEMPFPSKKQCINKTVEPEFSKDPNFTFSSNVPEDGVFKAKNQGSTKKAEPLSKKTATTARGPVGRYRLETELKTKNQLLEIAKQQLHSKLAGAQCTIKDLREKNEVLEEEVQKLKKFQDNCMVILESRNIDPVTGNEILEEEDTKECQKQTMLLTEKLKEELRLFSQMAAKQEELLTTTAMWKLAENDRNNFLEKQTSFQRETEEYAAIVGQMELLLDT